MRLIESETPELGQWITEDQIECLKLEKLHRFVFDEIYDQDKKKLNKWEESILSLYKAEILKYPNFRSIIKDFASSVQGLDKKFIRYDNI